MALFVAATAGAGCARAPQSPAAADSAVTASPSAAPHAAPEGASASPRAPLPARSAGPAAVPAALATAAAAAAAGTAAPAARAAEGPAVLSVTTSPEVVHNGEHVQWDVRTTPDVVSVTAHVSAYNLPLVRRSAGRFGLDFAVPSNVPGFFHGTYNLNITARNERGETAERSVSVTFE